MFPMNLLPLMPKGIVALVNSHKEALKEKTFNSSRSVPNSVLEKWYASQCWSFSFFWGVELQISRFFFAVRIKTQCFFLVMDLYRWFERRACNEARQKSEVWGMRDLWNGDCRLTCRGSSCAVFHNKCHTYLNAKQFLLLFGTSNPIHGFLSSTVFASWPEGHEWNFRSPQQFGSSFIKLSVKVSTERWEIVQTWNGMTLESVP